MTKRFIEFATQNTDNGEINNGFQDIKTGEWYYTKDSENAKKICDLLNELNNEVKSQSLVIKGYQERTEKVFNENEQLKGLIKKTLETTPIEHTLAIELKNSVRELYD